MPQLMLHHVSILTSDVERSLAFYRDVLGLRPLPRPDFPIGGSWLACGDRQVHLVQHPTGTYRTGEIDNNDTHFALRTDDFEGMVRQLEAHGFSEHAPEGAAGFAQLFVLDPDRNVVEVNAALL